jgi:hypothetical protein
MPSMCNDSPVKYGDGHQGPPADASNIHVPKEVLEHFGATILTAWPSSPSCRPRAIAGGPCSTRPAAPSTGGLARSIALLRKAISALEEEIADAGPVVEPAKQSTLAPVIEAMQESKTTPKADEIRMLRPRRWGGIAFEAAWRRAARWWRRRD